MGFLSRLFGQPLPKSEQDVLLQGLGTFSTQVVGESHYQEKLSKICGGFSEKGVEYVTSARLIHADENPYDNKAIRVEISGMTVGYLSREEARYYRERMQAAGHAGMTATCKAKITGGWYRGKEDIGNFGVTLDLPANLVESTPNGTSIKNNQKEALETNIIEFNVEKVQPEELSECNIKDYVSLWVPKGDSQKVYIFRKGSVGGTGRIGYLPSKYSSLIATHLSNGLKYETEIIEIDVNKLLCKIKCRLISKEETLAKEAVSIESARNNLKTELQKKYTPKNSLTIRAQLPKSHKLIEGQELFLEKQTKEYYLQNVPNLQINFVDTNGAVVAKKTNEPKLIRSVLRAYFSECPMKLQISSIETPDKYILNYVEHIEAKVKVSFGEGA